MVIGGGPAGSALAITLRQQGISCVLMEHMRFPRHLPGETLLPGTETLFRQLGVWDQINNPSLLRPAGLRIRHNDKESLVSYGRDETGEWRGFQISRHTLDKILLDHARNLGTAVLMPCRAYRLEVSQRRVVGIHSDQGLFMTRFVVDAAGGNHWLARQLGINVRAFSPPLKAAFGYFAGNVKCLNEYPLFDQDNDGWTWLAMIDKNCLHWTRVNIPGKTSSMHQTSKDRVLKALSTHADDLQMIGQIRGANVTWRIMDAVAGDGFFVVGDAAAVIDPASSHGVIKAFMTGMYAGHLIAQCLIRPGIRNLALSEYERYVRAWFHKDISVLQGQYNTSFPGWNNQNIQ